MFVVLTKVLNIFRRLLSVYMHTVAIYISDKPFKDQMSLLYKDSVRTAQ